VRALKLVAENARGTSYVRQGAKSCRVALELAGSEPVLDASTVVTVERGKGVSSYTLLLPGMHAEPVVYTKCASGVPDGVSQGLQLGETKLWVAGQFDRPYLLDETGAEVARVLGKLTNVNMIYAAVRESNRRASEARRAYSSKASELDSVTESGRKFARLPGRLAAADEAQTAMGYAEELEDIAFSLNAGLETLKSSAARLRTSLAQRREIPSTDRLEKLAEVRARVSDRLDDVESARERCSTATVGLRLVPETENLSRLLAQRANLRQALEKLSETDGSVVRLSHLISDARAAADEARHRFSQALSLAGSCPLCGASAAHAQVDNVV